MVRSIVGGLQGSAGVLGVGGGNNTVTTKVNYTELEKLGSNPPVNLSALNTPNPPSGATGTNTSGSTVAAANSSLFGLEPWEIAALVGVVVLIVIVFAVRHK